MYAQARTTNLAILSHSTSKHLPRDAYEDDILDVDCRPNSDELDLSYYSTLRPSMSTHAVATELPTLLSSFIPDDLLIGLQNKRHAFLHC